jgi:elongation factor Ts
MPSIDQIKQLREETGVSITECKKVLEEANNDIEKAKELLRKKGRELAGKKSERIVKTGIIDTYVHLNKKVGVILDIRCESDFVAKAEDFQNLAHEICLQIAAMNPLVVKADDISSDVLEKEKEIYLTQLKELGKPQEIADKIIEGKIEKYQKENALISQAWIKDNSKTVNDLIQEYIVKLGENIIIDKFSRYEI